jgi:hypothetical protein
LDKPAAIFVSHSHRDNAWCRDFVRALRSRGADVWYDEQSLGFGRLAQVITHEMQRRPVFIPVFTPTSVASKWVQREVEAAIYLQDKDPDRIVLPVIAARCDVPPLWITFRRISGPDDGPLGAEEAAAQVAEVLHLPTVELPSEGALSSAASAIGGDSPMGPTLGAKSETAALKPGFRLFAHAITDVYDEDRKRSLVAYPSWLVASLVLEGLIAFLLTGVLTTHLRRTLVPSGEASWPLFIWMGLLGITLAAAILRHPTLRRYRLRLVIASIISLLVVGMAVYEGSLFQGPVNSLSNGLQVRPNSFVFTLVNVLILATYAVFSTRRWVRRAAGLPLTRPSIDLGNDVVPDEVRQPDLVEIVFGDLFIGGLVALLLAGVSRADVLDFVASALQLGGRVDRCMVSWAFGSCTLTSQAGGPVNPLTLSHVNLVLALLLITTSLMLAALYGVLNGIGALPSTAPSTLSPRYGTSSVSTAVSEAVLATLRSSIDRFLRGSLQGTALAIRELAWPLVIVVWAIATAATAFAALDYLFPTVSCSLPDCIAGRLTSPSTYLQAGATLLWGTVAVYTLIGAAGLLVFSQRVVTNTLTYMVRVTMQVLLVYWLFIVALAALGQMLVLSQVTARNPFLFVDPVGIASLALAFAVGQVLLFQSIKRFYAVASEK